MAGTVGLRVAHKAGALRSDGDSAPGIADPDLSSTLPEKLPVAWPRRSGASPMASTQTAVKRRVLNVFVLAEKFTVLKQLAPLKMLFIFEPLSDEVVLYGLRQACAGLREELTGRFSSHEERGFSQSRCGERSITNGEWLCSRSLP